MKANAILQRLLWVSRRYLIGRILQPDEFSGGEAPGHANFELRRLGFVVVRKADDDTSEEKVPKDWNADHRRILAPKLQGRSDGSIEFKHQNVSGVLVELGLPYIEGYKPRSNYQGILATEVETFLEGRPGFLDKLAAAPALNPEHGKPISSPDLNVLIEDPPEKILAPANTAKPWLSRRARKIDFAERDAANRNLGKLGEQFVFDLERYRLTAADRDDLAQRVVWASQDIGDGLGYDILSFDAADGSELMLEVIVVSSGSISETSRKRTGARYLVDEQLCSSTTAKITGSRRTAGSRRGPQRGWVRFQKEWAGKCRPDPSYLPTDSVNY